MERLRQSFGRSRSYAILVALGLCSGLLGQTILVYSGERVAIVSVVGGAVLLAAAVTAARGLTRRQSRAVLVVAPLFLWICLSLAWSPSAAYRFEKLVAYCFCAAMFAVPVLNLDFDAKGFIKVYFWVVFLVFFAAIVGMLRNVGGFFDMSDAARSVYLTAGYFGGSLLLILGCSRVVKSYVAEVLLMIVVGCGVAVTGARGPLVFAVPFMLGGLLFRRRYVSVAVCVLLVVFGGVLVRMFSDVEGVGFYIERAVARFALLWEGEVSSRIDLWAMLSSWLNDFDAVVVGYGVGSWGWVVNRVDERAYPHNIILELLFEHGVLGLGFFAFAVCFGLLAYYRSKEVLPGVWFFLFVYESLNLMKSFTLSDARVFFFLLGLLFAARINIGRRDDRRFGAVKSPPLPILSGARRRLVADGYSPSLPATTGRGSGR